MTQQNIVKMIFGSHLYGTNTPESDMDYKGIFMPSRKDIYLNNIPKSINHTTKTNNNARNTNTDIDSEIYSLHYFIKLACEGQTVAIDMLHAPPDMLLEQHPLWNELFANRKYFYTRNLSAFIGYARRQAAKYGIRGSRLNAMSEVIGYLQQFNPDRRLIEVWDNLPTGDHIHFLPANAKTIHPLYQICGKKFMPTIKISCILEALHRSYNEYGKRAQLAKENKGIDWKAVSHAIRAAIQMKEIFSTGDLHFPLKQAGLLREIKAGKLDYTTFVAPLLEQLMDNVEDLSAKSNLPDKVNRSKWDTWLYNAVDKWA